MNENLKSMKIYKVLLKRNYGYLLLIILVNSLIPTQKLFVYDENYNNESITA